jgi:hypothetical protein
MNARPLSSAYLSSSVTVSKALRIDSGSGAFIGARLLRAASREEVEEVRRRKASV